MPREGGGGKLECAYMYIYEEGTLLYILLDNNAFKNSD